jgi:hypothetical protein
MTKTVAQLALELSKFQEDYTKNKQETRTQFENLRQAINKLNAHVAALEKLNPSLGIRPAVLTAQQATPSLVSPTAAPAVSVNGVFTAVHEWYNQKWTTPFKLFFWCLLAIVAYQIYQSGFIGNTLARYSIIPSIIQPTIDPNSLEAVAYPLLQKEPYYSDTASKRVFVGILTELNSLVTYGDIKDMEGYANQFGKLTQAKLNQKEYQNWSSFWNSLMPIVQQRFGAKDVQSFNTQLQKLKPLLGTVEVSDVEPETVPLPLM